MMHNLKLMRHVQLGIKTLLLHKLRSLLTMLGVVFGVGSVIAMLSVGEGASQEALAQIQKLGPNNIIITSIKPTEDEANLTRRTMMSVYGLKYIDEQRIRETFPTIARTVPVKIVRKEGRLGDHSQELRVVGTTPEWFELVERPLIAGRKLTMADIRDHAAVCVLTEKGARALLATHHSIGQTIRIGSDAFEVVGIVKSESSGGSGVQTPDRDTDAYIPIDTARERFGDIMTRMTAGSFQREMVELHMIIAQVDQNLLHHVESTANAIQAMFERFHGKTDYRVDVPLALLRQAEAEQRRRIIVLGSIAGISLLVGGIGIMNIMLASVTERTREIGVRRAIGGKRRQIIGQFLIETVVLSTVGGLIGMGMGILIPFLVSYFTGMPTVITAFSLILSLGISVAVGVIFGLYPAVRAARLDPIVALRHE